MVKVLVCGGRKYKDMDAVFKALDTFHKDTPITEIIEGGAPGADRFANEWAKVNNIRCTTFFASWNTHGKSAGIIRNQDMLDRGDPDYVFAFPGGTGTADMVNRAKSSGKPVNEFK